MMVRAKRIYILMIKVNRMFSFFVVVFSKIEMENTETLVKVWENSKNCGNT